MNQAGISHHILSNKFQKLFRYQHMIFLHWRLSSAVFVQLSTSIHWTIYQKSSQISETSPDSPNSSFTGSLASGALTGERSSTIFSGQVPEHPFIHARFVNSTMAFTSHRNVFLEAICFKTNGLSKLLASESGRPKDVEWTNYFASRRFLRSRLIWICCGLVSDITNVVCVNDLRCQIACPFDHKPPLRYFEIFSRPSIWNRCWRAMFPNQVKCWSSSMQWLEAKWSSCAIWRKKLWVPSLGCSLRSFAGGARVSRILSSLTTRLHEELWTGKNWRFVKLRVAWNFIFR